MEAVVKKLYEAMFLIDSAEAASDWEGINTIIKNILERAEAEIVSIRKWDERKLAYQINGKTRGTYILCYFRAEGKSIRDIERDVQLSERIMRVLILSAEHVSEEDIEKAPILPAPASPVARRGGGQKDSKMGTQKDTVEHQDEQEAAEKAEAKQVSA